MFWVSQKLSLKFTSCSFSQPSQNKQIPPEPLCMVAKTKKNNSFLWIYPSQRHISIFSNFWIIRDIFSKIQNTRYIVQTSEIVSPSLPNMAYIWKYYLTRSCFLPETSFFVPPLCLFQKQWSTYHSSRVLEQKQNFVPPLCCSADIALPRFLVHYFEHFWAHFLNKNISSVNCRLYLCPPPPLNLCRKHFCILKELAKLEKWMSTLCSLSC